MVAQLKNSLRSVILALLITWFSSLLPLWQRWGSVWFNSLRQTLRRVDLVLLAIWLFASGYFAAYTPFSAFTKGVSKGWIASPAHKPLSGFAILPVSTLVATVVTYTLYTCLGWWKYARRWQIGGTQGLLRPYQQNSLVNDIATGILLVTRFASLLGGDSMWIFSPHTWWSVTLQSKLNSMDLPCPRWLTFLAGVATAGIMLTTTMAYALDGVSITFVILLLRGLVLLIGPPLDKIRKRKVGKWSWIATTLSLLGLVVAFLEKKGYTLSLLAILDVTIYLFGYIVRLWAMDKLGKSDDPAVRRGYIVEEQMVVTPIALLILLIVALVGKGEIAGQVRYGFTGVWYTPALPWVMAIGVFSQLAGTCGGLVLLDNRGTSFCLPVNRASSILAGVLGEAILMHMLGKGIPSLYQLIGAGFVMGALLVLTIPGVLKKRHEAKKQVVKTLPETMTVVVNERWSPDINVSQPNPALAFASRA